MIPALPSCSAECHDSVSFWSRTGYSSRLYLTQIPDPWADKIWIKGQGGAGRAVALAGPWGCSVPSTGHQTAPGYKPSPLGGQTQPLTSPSTHSRSEMLTQGWWSAGCASELRFLGALENEMRQSACAVSAPLPGCRSLFPGSRELRAVRSTEQTSSSPRHLGMLSFASPLSQAGTAPGLGLPARTRSCAGVLGISSTASAQQTKTFHEKAERRQSKKHKAVQQTPKWYCWGNSNLSGSWAKISIRESREITQSEPRSLTGFTDLSLKSLCSTWNAEIFFFFKISPPPPLWGPSFAGGF